MVDLRIAYDADNPDNRKPMKGAAFAGGGPKGDIKVKIISGSANINSKAATKGGGGQSSGGEPPMNEILERLVKVETKLEYCSNKSDIAELKARIDACSTKADVSDAKHQLVVWMVGTAIACTIAGVSVARLIPS